MTTKMNHLNRIFSIDPTVDGLNKPDTVYNIGRVVGAIIEPTVPKNVPRRRSLVVSLCTEVTRSSDTEESLKKWFKNKGYDLS
jgi:hypothetical protein